MKNYIKIGIFVIATSISPDQLSDEKRNSLLTTTIFLGMIHLTIEVRQFIWKPLKYIKDFWNYFDLGAYSLAIVTSILWLHYNSPPPVQLISASNLLLDLRLMLFLRVFKNFGAYFAIIIGVAKKVFWFLIIIMIIILSFSHAFYLLLKPNQDVALDYPDFNDDSNNPWNLEAILAQKAKIIIEIELFYLLPNQRRWRNCFNKVLNDDICKTIKEVDDSNEDAENLPYISDGLRNLFDMPKKKDHETIDFNSRFQLIEDKLGDNKNNIEKLNHNNDQLLLQMQTLLKEINEIKNLK
ncbi:13740_t:CDS:2 [Entrophospora sp. SA101]|nr:13740_t:CDS:2 [Entrophospora sp. SA101]